MSVLESVYKPPLQLDEALALGIFAGYFVVIAWTFSVVYRSLTDGVPTSTVFKGTPYFFLRMAVGALLCTWYYMIQYMRWSFENYASGIDGKATIASWLVNTALFEEAWTVVSIDPRNWSLSAAVCVSTVIFTYVVWTESGRKGIKSPWAYMVLGQLVAMSVAMALFFAASTARKRVAVLDTRQIKWICIPLLASLATVHYVPSVVGTEKFLPNLLAMHVFLVIPLFFSPKTTPVSPEVETASKAQGTSAHLPKNEAKEDVLSDEAKVRFRYLLLLSVFSLLVAGGREKPGPIPGRASNLGILQVLVHAIQSHPAQGSITLDLVWIIFSGVIYHLSGATRWTYMAYLTVGLMFAIQLGVNWTLVASIVPIASLAAFGLLGLHLGKVRKANAEKRKAFLDSIGVLEETVIPGTDRTPPGYAPRRTMVGFWHPYCNAGGGGERVLWTAIAHLQATHPEVISLVYSGDYPAASKEEILAKIRDRFSIALAPETLYFVPLPSRYVVDGGYWKTFTLLGQSLGSLYLLHEGFCGADGLWGDIFIDTMGYAFTYPFVRLVAGPEIAIGTYTHYPTVSADMVRRVRERSFGVENAGASASWVKTQIKLVYYRIFTSLYATSLLFAEYLMTNSSWTQAHVSSLLDAGRRGFLASVVLMDEKSLEKNGGDKAVCEVLYPPCDTAALVGFPLTGRSREVLSLAQFRPEKEHWKQVEALAKLFELCPEYKSGEGKVKLVMVGGARHPADEKRVEELRALVQKLGVQDNVEIVVNAPYAEVLNRLSKASLGLNTMQDEHFGINVVEFMAAGLIPIVHASAGPLLDIVVPYRGQRTGFHAKTSEDFAEALKEALRLPEQQAIAMRTAARSLAIEKFSEERFVEGFDKGWEGLTRISRVRRRAEAMKTGGDVDKGLKRLA